jgi:nicotinamidase-related amidase
MTWNPVEAVRGFGPRSDSAIGGLSSGLVAPFVEFTERENGASGAAPLGVARALLMAPNMSDAFGLDGTGAGSAARSRTALILVDVVNPLDFPGGQGLLVHAVPAAHRIAALRRRARDSGVPVIYVNDNFDCWHLGFRELVEQVRNGAGPGRVLLDELAPDLRHDYYVLKPMHSAFFHTAFEVLLRRLAVEKLILTGFASDNCVLFTAADAYMRRFDIAVPEDCVASQSAEDNRRAIEQMERLLKADTRPSPKLAFAGSSERDGE